MTHTIEYQYDEIIQTGLPGFEIHVVYTCESEITFDEEGLEESNRLTSITATVNGRPEDVTLPEAKHGEKAKWFLATLQGAARQALYAKQLREETELLTKIETT
jgi:hypothetical protein